MQIIDFHTHVYPPKIADKASRSIRDFYGLEKYWVGTPENLLRWGGEAGVTRFVLLQVSIKPEQTHHINAFALDEMRAHAAFSAFGAEPDLRPLFAEAPFYLPRFDAAEGRYVMARVRDPERDLAPGLYGIPEPRPELPAADETLRRELLYLVPAVACDRAGNRIGRGGGWYDRILAGVRRAPVAVIYGCQLSEEPLPHEAHDLAMGLIVTEAGVVRCGNGGAERSS